MVEIPKAIWRLPPQQRVLKTDETRFDLHAVAQELTIVMSTSITKHTPSVEPVVAALESLQANLALRWCRKLLVFDKVPSREEIDEMRRDPKIYHHVCRGGKWEQMWNDGRESYDAYKAALQSMKDDDHPALHNTELVFLEEFGHLFGTVKRGFSHVQTRYVLVTQHDLRLGGHFVAADVQLILEALNAGLAKYVLLNRDTNSSVRTKAYFRLTPERDVHLDAPKTPSGLHLTAMQGFSDQTHFVDAEWYRKEVIASIPREKQLTCMEHLLHDRWKESPERLLTFLYGGVQEGPFVLDLIYGSQVYDVQGHLWKLPPPPSRPAE